MKKFCPSKEIGILFDLHDTLVDSRTAWIESLKKLLPTYNLDTLSQIYDKMSRKELCKYLGINYNKWLNKYQQHLKINKDIFSLVLELSTHYRCFIVTNASLNRVKFDVTLLQPFVFERIYTKEDGKKPDLMYLSHILSENSLSMAILVGNNPKEDYIDCRNIKSVITTQNKNATNIKLEINTIIQEYIANNINSTILNMGCNHDIHGIPQNIIHNLT